MRTATTILGLACCAAAFDGADGKKYESKEGKYAIRFPAGAKVQTQTQKADGADMHVATAKDGNKVYYVMDMDLPGRNIPAKGLFDRAEQGGVKQSGGKLVSSKDITFGKGKWPGREIVVGAGGEKIKSRVYLVGTRLYTTVVGGPKDFATGKEAEQFFDSFEITK